MSSKSKKAISVAVASTVAASNVETSHSRISAAYDARIAANSQQASFFAKEKALFTVACVAALESYSVDCSALATIIGNSDKSSNSAFVAKYALEKVRKIAQALAQDMFSVLDRYTQSIVLNSRKLETLSAKSALVCLSKAICYDETDAQQAIKRYGNCVASTASTQRSSTREALRVLNVASVTKAKRDDAIVFADSAIANAVKTLCDRTLAA